MRSVADLVMSGLVPSIQSSVHYERKTWMAGTKPGHDETEMAVAHTFSNGTLIALRFSSHSGTGRFLERMKSGLNSFD